VIAAAHPQTRLGKRSLSMKKLIPILALGAMTVLFATGCASMANPDERGAGLNAPDVARNTSTGSIAGSPDPAPPQ
jgi:hypothetical protein